MVASDRVGASAGLVDGSSSGVGVGARCWALAGPYSGRDRLVLGVEAGRLVAQEQVDGAWVALVEPGPEGCDLVARNHDGRAVDTRHVPRRR